MSLDKLAWICAQYGKHVSEPEFYGDFAYKFKMIMGRTDFSDQFRQIIVRH